MARLSDDDHRHLLTAISLGDRDAFKALYDSTSPRLYAAALRLLKRPAWAEEVLQDCFVTVWNRASSYNTTGSSPMTWLTHIVRNRAIDWLRGTDAHLTELDDTGMAGLADPDGSPLDNLLRNDASRRLGNCMGLLAAEQRQCLVLAYYHGLSHEQVAGTLQRPLGTTKSWIRRGLKQLKECLGL
ncbi:MAG TPA: sigma-70 family RNA polymerase sigma factor [Burkholderiaceae bacterium]|nr:sigma-70 family RNA polymerase sigma factor [Burkholderiaceae bacterium]